MKPLALSLPFAPLLALSLAACSAAPTAAEGTSDDAITDTVPAPAAPRVASYSTDDLRGDTSTKMRWSIDRAATTEGYQPELKIALSGKDRRFSFQAATPRAGGKPVVYIELGRGQAPIAAGTYSCAKAEAVVLMIDADETRSMTAVADGASRPCTVAIENAEPMELAPGVSADTPMLLVTGHFNADLGPRETGDAGTTTTHTIEGAFAAIVTDSAQSDLFHPR